MTKLRVVHFNHTGVMAGAERVLITALPALATEGCESIVLSPAGALEREAARIGVAHQRCPALQARFTWNPLALVRYTRSVLQSVRSLRAQVASLRPDVIHANSVRAGIVATLATARRTTPVVWHVHDTLPQHPFSPAIRALAALSDRTSAIAVSHATARTFAGYLFGSRINGKLDVLHNVSRDDGNRSTEEQRARLRAELGVGERFLVGCVAQVCKRKNQIGLVELFAKALEQEPGMVLAVAGSPLFRHHEPYMEKLRERVHQLGLEQQILLLGNRSDVPLLLDTMDLLVLPSLQEPFPMIVLEAMRAALPVVAYAVDGVPELLADGQTGWLVPPREPDQMARTIVWAKRHPAQRARLGAAACAQARKGSPQSYSAGLSSILRKRADRVHKVQAAVVSKRAVGTMGSSV